MSSPCAHWALLALVLPSSSCSATPAPQKPTGEWLDRDQQAKPKPASQVSVKPTPWELAPQLSSFTPATERGQSHHFTGEFEGEVRINPLATGYPHLGPRRKLPAGAAIVELHYARSHPDPVVLFAMVKQRSGYDPEGGDWEYLILSPEGEATHRGLLPPCKRCHAEAPHDFLFGGPR